VFDHAVVENVAQEDLPIVTSAQYVLVNNLHLGDKWQDLNDNLR
jgi:hypothetical protein